MKRFLYLFLFFPFVSEGQIVINNIGEAIEIAGKSNRDLSISGNKTSIEKENVKVARSSFVPQIKAVSNFDYNYALPVQLIPAEFLGGRPGEYKALQFGTKYNWTGGAEASFPLINAALWTDAKIASLTREAAKQNEANARFEIMKQVCKGYYLTSLSALSLDISEQNFKIADSLKQISGYKFNNGLLEPLEYNRIISSWLRAKNEMERNRVVLINNNNSLKYTLGLSQTDTLILTEVLKEIPSTSQLNSSPESYPSVKEKQLLVSSSLWSMRREKYKRLPELSLAGRYLIQAQRNQLDFFHKGTPWYRIGVVGLRFEMPLFTGFARSSNIHKLQYRYENQKKELEKETERVQMEDKELLSNYYNYSLSVNNLRESFRLAEQNIKISFFKYNQGVFSLDQYLNVLNESLNTQGQYLNSLSDLYITRTILDLKNNLK
jgi:outer membrane protein TolC